MSQRFSFSCSTRQSQGKARVSYLKVIMDGAIHTRCPGPHNMESYKLLLWSSHNVYLRSGHCWDTVVKKKKSSRIEKESFTSIWFVLSCWVSGSHHMECSRRIRIMIQVEMHLSRYFPSLDDMISQVSSVITKYLWEMDKKKKSLHE